MRFLSKFEIVHYREAFRLIGVWTGWTGWTGVKRTFSFFVFRVLVFSATVPEQPRFDSSLFPCSPALAEAVVARKREKYLLRRRVFNFLSYSGKPTKKAGKPNQAFPQKQKAAKLWDSTNLHADPKWAQQAYSLLH